MGACISWSPSAAIAALGDQLIHAPTGAVLFQLREVGLLGRIGERVDEIGEPVFAWS